jgi:hypothetical protein
MPVAKTTWAAQEKTDKKQSSTIEIVLLCRLPELLLYGSANGARTGASAAADALVGIDHELAIALGDSIHGAIGSAGAAGDALVINNICHNTVPPVSIFSSYRLLYSVIIARFSLHCKQRERTVLLFCTNPLPPLCAARKIRLRSSAGG